MLSAVHRRIPLRRYHPARRGCHTWCTLGPDLGREDVRGVVVLFPGGSLASLFPPFATGALRVSCCGRVAGTEAYSGPGGGGGTFGEGVGFAAPAVSGVWTLRCGCVRGFLTSSQFWSRKGVGHLVSRGDAVWCHEQHDDHGPGRR